MQICPRCKGSGRVEDRPWLPRATAVSQRATAVSQRATDDPERIIEAVATYYGVSVSDLKGHSRRRDIVLPRHIAMYLLRAMTHRSLLEVGACLGGRDHSSVSHGVEQTSIRMRDPDFAFDVRLCREQMSPHARPQ